MEERKALIGMSGGVDSSVAAFLTKQAGFSCIGATMRLYDNETIGEEPGRTCCTLDDAEDARSVARRLGIPHYVFNFKDDFEDKVIRKFVSCYEAGLTPNPCIDCNRHLKFDRLLRRAQELGCEYVVSGHYAQVRQDADTGRYLLYKAADRAKDQTYFLACLDQTQLSHILFPLGQLTKEEVRKIAEENGFVTARKRDSQDICFVPDGDYVAFMERYTGKTYAAGEYLDLNGKVLGKHRGAVAYTLGQRKGLGIALGAPAYVCRKDVEKNTVTLGPSEALFSPALRAKDWNWYPFPELTEPLRVTAKTRHSQLEQAATVYPEENGFARVEFDTPQRAVTPGQAVVLYSGEIVVGGGTITEAIWNV
ncbi:MAG: tRNA 2-thiouridine(34) synthase MnmA [Oscillospiraceae bacterium]|nr:tRNA 2-thiouridine(34) synthase MnmA [Oscillospiraceae bacterium]